MNINEGEQHNTILSNNRLGNNNSVIGLLSFATSFWGVLLGVILVAGAVSLAVTNIHLFASIMSKFFESALILIGVGVACGLAWFVIKHIIGGIIQYVIGGFIKHVIEPLRKERVVFANDNFAAYTGNITVAHHDESRYNYSIKQVDGPAAPLALPAPAATPVPSARQLIEDGTVQAVIQRGEIIVGFLEDGTMKTLAYDLLYSTDLGGVGGSGKTTTAFWLCVQEMFAGTRLIVIDPHIHVKRRGEAQGLGQLLMPFKFAHHFAPCDDDPGEVMRRARWMRDENERRTRKGVNLDELPQIMFVIDEFNTVIENPEIKDELGDIIAKVQREGRKLGLFFLLVGHRWSQQDIGNIKIRTNAATVMAHYYNDEGQADRLIGNGQGKLCLQLKQGAYWLKGLMTGDLVKVRTPAIYEHDSPLILNALGQPTTVVESTIEELQPKKQHGDTYRQTDEVGDTFGDTYRQPGKPMEIPTDIMLTHAQKEKMLMVLEMDTRQASQNQIIETVWQVNPKDRAGQAAAEELRLIRAYLAELNKRALAS